MLAAGFKPTTFNDTISNNQTLPENEPTLPSAPSNNGFNLVSAAARSAGESPDSAALTSVLYLQ
jgi:hypothetical protein